MTKLERKLKEWKVIGVFKTKDELMDKAKKEWILAGFKKNDVEYTLEYYNEMLKFNENEAYAINLKYLDIDIYSKVIEYEKEMLKNEQKEAKERRKAQQSMSIDSYRIVQKQQQAEYLVKREMKRMAKMLGRKNLLSYEPKVYVLNKKHWKKDGCIGYVTQDNMIFLPEYYFKKRKFYDPNGYGLKNVIYKKDEKIVKVIRHELTHLFVREEFENTTFIKNISSDASPIFLYYLAFFGADFGGGYKVQSKYEKELCEQVKEITHKDIKTMSLKLLVKIELFFEHLKDYGYFSFSKDAEKSYIENGVCLYFGYEVLNFTMQDLNNLFIKWDIEFNKKLEEIKNKQAKAA